MNGLSQQSFWLDDWLVEPLLNQIQHRETTEGVSLEPKVMDLLVLLAERAGQVISADEIVSEIWKGQVVGDNSIYQNIAQLRKALKDKAGQPRYIATVPKKGYRLIASVIPHTEDSNTVVASNPHTAELPDVSIALDEISPVEIVTTPEAPPALATAADVAPTSHPFWQHKWLLAYVALFVLLLIGTLSWFHYFASDVERLSEESARSKAVYRALAVLPFSNMSEGDSSDYFADGITDELIIELSKLSGLQVVARTSVFAFKGVNKDIREIGAALNVDALVQGSVRRTAEKAKVSVQLIDAKDGFQIWSDSYELELADILQLESTIAHQIAVKLEANLSSPIASSADKTNIAAYELYLLGRHHFQLRTQSSLHKALGFYQQAIAIDPEYALAYSGMVDSYLLLSEYGDYSLSRSLENAKPALDKALFWGEYRAEVQASVGLYYYYAQQFELSEQHFRQSLSLNPGDSTVHMWLGLTLLNKGAMQEALEALKMAHSLDPLHITIAINLALTESMLGNTSQGVKDLLALQTYYPSSVQLFQALSLLAARIGDVKYSLQWAQQARQLEHSIMAWLVLANAQLLSGDFQTVFQSLTAAQQISDDNHRLTYYWALYYLSMGDWVAFEAFSEHLLQKNLPLKEAPDLSMRLALVWHGVALANQQKYAEASYYLEQGLQLDDNKVLISPEFDMYFFASLIDCYQKMGLKSQAEKLFNRSIAMSYELEKQHLNSIWFLMTKARVLAAMRKVPQSKAILNEAKQAGFAYTHMLTLDPIFN